MCFYKKPVFEFAVFLFVVSFYVIPPLIFQYEFTAISKPETFLGFVSAVVFIYLAAAAEELVYRVYLPAKFGHLVLSFKTNWIRLVFSEALPLLLFSAAHKYLGSNTVIIAFAAGIIFRILFIKLNGKNKPVKPAVFLCFLHGSYNLTVYFFIWKGFLKLD